MFAPLKIWRKWHRKSNLNQKRHAVASALAASACAPLVLAKGHRVMDVPELPLVAETLNLDSTAGLLSALNSLGAKADLERVRKSKKMRAGQGKYRNARFTHRRGPLVVYGDANPNVKKAARNLPGVDVCNVNRLNLLQLAPGGTVGRFVIFTRDAFEALDSIFGTYAVKGQGKSGYCMQRNVIDCADLARIINADQVQSKLRGIRVAVPDHELHDKTKRNPLKNKTMMQKLNPNSKAAAAAEVKAVAARAANRATALKQKRSKAGRKEKAVRTARFTGLADGLEEAFVAAHQIILDEIKEGRIEASESEEEEDDE
jgi:large subunit ribosomal protein L4e